MSAFWGVVFGQKEFSRRNGWLPPIVNKFSIIVYKLQSTTPTSTPPQFWQRARHFHGLFWEPFSYLQIHGVHSGGLFPESRRRHPLSRRRIGGTWCLHPPGQRSEVREVFEDDAAMLASLVLSLVTSPKAWVSRGFPLGYFPSLIWKDLSSRAGLSLKITATVCLSGALVVYYRFSRSASTFSNF